MAVLTAAIQVELWAFLGSLAGIVGYGLLTGRVRSRDLLLEKASGGFCAARAQLLFVSFVFGAYYLMQLSSNSGVLPDIPPAVLAILVGSHGVYLGDKSLKSLGRG